jgi:rubrerythrin
METANPFTTTDELAGELVKLCQLEHALALEYLYAMYSVKDPAKAAGQALNDAVTFVRHEILGIAVSEMRHLRWANQLIWELDHAGLTTKKFGPSLARAVRVPTATGDRPSELRLLTQNVLNDFIAVEKPSGTLDGAYARVLATLRQTKYPEALEQLAERILADGMQHFTRFREIQRVLAPFATGDSPAYLQKLVKASRAQGKAATDLYRTILTDLESAYESGDMEDAAKIADARTTMFKLKDAADALANAGKGVPYF